MTADSGLPTIAELLPHRGRMLLLDELLSEHDEKSVVCRTTLREDFLFARNGRVDAVVSVELIAQALGACVGLADRRKGRLPRIGFLVGVRDATFAVGSFNVGDVLEVTATHVWGEETLGNFRGTVAIVPPGGFAAGAVVATCELSVYAGDLAGVARDAG